MIRHDLPNATLSTPFILEIRILMADKADKISSHWKYIHQGSITELRTSTFQHYCVRRRNDIKSCQNAFSLAKLRWVYSRLKREYYLKQLPVESRNI